jgi:pimeloyl-ACP methyl ester carboxylesterase
MGNDFGGALRMAGGGLLAAGVLAAGAAVGAVVERAVLARSARPDVDDSELGSLRGTVYEITADDDVILHAEVDEADPATDTGLTIVFAHGYGLSLDSWHYQRQALRGRARLVFYDQRSHGRSGRADFDSHHIDQLGRDLETVIETLAPSGPLMLIGHSMGGMTLMAFADLRPDIIEERVYGVAFIATTPTSIENGSLGLPLVGPMLHRVAPHVFASLAKRKEVVEKAVRGGSDLALLVTRLYSFGSTAPDAAGKFVAEMIAGTPIDVMAEFLPALQDHDKRHVLQVFQSAEVLVIAGDADRLVPLENSAQIVEGIPGAEFVILPNAGHMLTLEHPDQVDDLLIELLDRVQRDIEMSAHPVA